MDKIIYHFFLCTDVHPMRLGVVGLGKGEKYNMSNNKTPIAVSKQNILLSLYLCLSLNTNTQFK